MAQFTALALTQPTIYETAIISYFLDKAAQEKIDPIDFAFHETIDGELVHRLSPGGLWDLECGIPAKHEAKTWLSSHNSTCNPAIFKASRPGVESHAHSLFLQTGQRGI